MSLLGQKSPKISSLSWYVRSHTRFSSSNEITNNAYNREIRQKYHYLKGNMMQLILGLGDFIVPKRGHNYWMID